MNCKTYIEGKGWIYNHELNHQPPPKPTLEEQIDLFEYRGGKKVFNFDPSPIIWPTETMMDKREREQKIKQNHNFN